MSKSHKKDPIIEQRKAQTVIWLMTPGDASDFLTKMRKVGVNIMAHIEYNMVVMNRDMTTEEWSLI